MRLLLDTHIFLWWVYDDPKLTQLSRSLIENTDNIKYIVH